jgi:hypothetical protein
MEECRKPCTSRSHDAECVTVSTSGQRELDLSKAADHPYLNPHNIREAGKEETLGEQLKQNWPPRKAREGGAGQCLELLASVQHSHAGCAVR